MHLTQLNSCYQNHHFSKLETTYSAYKSNFTHSPSTEDQELLRTSNPGLNQHSSPAPRQHANLSTSLPGSRKVSLTRVTILPRDSIKLHFILHKLTYSNRCALQQPELRTRRKLHMTMLRLVLLVSLTHVTLCTATHHVTLR